MVFVDVIAKYKLYGNYSNNEKWPANLGLNINADKSQCCHNCEIMAVYCVSKTLVIQFINRLGHNIMGTIIITT